MLVQTASQPKYTHPGPSRLVSEGMRAPFVLVTALFFLWGLPNNRKRQTNACRIICGCFVAQVAGVRFANR